jgi:2-phosphosulfolactate phosphatase
VAEMRLDVLLTPAELVPAEIAGRTVVMLDVLRASTSIVEALAAGARTLFPVATIEEAIGLAKTLGREEVLLAGERKALPIEGFDLGNSPGEFTAERVGGKIVVMSTTNGTLALTAASGAERVIVGAWTNFQAVVDDLVRTQAEPVFLCAGRDRVFGLEDAVCAGQMAAALMKALPDTEWEMNDGAVAALALAEEFADPAKLFPHTAAGRAIVDAGLGDDLAYCAQTDLRDVLPVLEGRQIVLAAVPAES